MIYLSIMSKTTFISKDYWQQRYEEGGNSGAGSYGRLAEYKTHFLNNFVKNNSIKTVIEFGSGDGNQLRDTRYPSYLGLDVSETSIEACSKLYSKDPTKSFLHYTPNLFNDDQGFISADLTLSLDVIFHLIEDAVFEIYIKQLFRASNKFVVIYASNRDEYNPSIPHLRHRKFTEFISKNIKGWELDQVEKNPYPYSPSDPDNTSFSDFFVYKKS